MGISHVHVCEINEDENKQGERRVALQEGKVPENLPLKKDRYLEMLVVTPRGEGDSPAAGLWSRALCVTETWWDNPRVLGQTAPGSPQSCVTSLFEGMPEIYEFSSCKWKTFSPFCFPPDFVAEGGAQELETLLYFITGTLLEKCSPLGSDLVKAPTSAEIWCSHLGSS